MSGPMHTPFTETECLSEKLMFDYIDQKLSGKENHTVEKHMMECDMCSDAMEGLEMVKDRSKLKSAATDINKRIHNPLKEKQETKVIWLDSRMKLAIAAAVAVLLVSVFFLNNQMKVSSEDKIVADNNIKLEEPANAAASGETPPPPPSPPVNDESTGKDITIKEQTPLAVTKNTVAPLEPGAKDNDLMEDKKNVVSGAGGDYFKKQADKDAKLDKNESIASQEESQPRDEATKQKAAKPEGRATLADDLAKSESQDRRKDDEKSASKGAANSTGLGTTTNSSPVLITKESEKSAEQDKITQRSFSKERAKKAETKAGKSAAPNKSLSEAPESKREETTMESVIANNENNNKGVNDSEETFTIVEQMPMFPGGDSAMVSFIKKNMVYPVIEKEAGISGTVYVTFIVDNTGLIKDTRVIKGLPGGDGCNKEAVRIIKLMPPWIPGKQNGARVNVQYNLPIKFSLK